MARFSDVLTIINGKNQKQVENPNGEYPIYGSGGMIGYADDFICDGETVIIGRKGNINKPIFVDRPFWNVDTAFGLSAKRDTLLPKYLYYFCEVFDFEKLNTTVTIPSLTKANLLDIEIKLPSLADQKLIVVLLDKLATLISLRKQQLVKLDELVKARSVEMFGKFNQYEPLESYATLITKGASPTWQGVNYADNGTLFITSENVREGYVDLGKRKYLDNRINKIQSRSILHRKDVLINIVGASIGRAAIFECDEDANINQAVALVRVNFQQLNERFLINYLNSSEALELYAKMKKGGARDNLSLKNIADLPIPLVPISLQEQFATFMEQIDKSKLTIQQSLDKLELLKKALMQEYFA